MNFHALGVGQDDILSQCPRGQTAVVGRVGQTITDQDDGLCGCAKAWAKASCIDDEPSNLPASSGTKRWAFARFDLFMATRLPSSGQAVITGAGVQLLEAENTELIS